MRTTGKKRLRASWVFAGTLLVACGGGGAPALDAASEDASAIDGGARDASPPDRDSGSPELDATLPDRDAASVDAASVDAASVDGISLGASAIAQRVFLSGPTTGTLTTSAVTTQSGSVLLASIARGTWAAESSAPTDDRGNAFSLVGTTHAYAAWPGSRTGLYDAAGAVGGAGHTFSLAWGDAGGGGDEVTISVVEITRATAIEDASWVERTAAGTLVSGSVTTAGPAMLVAWWWGAGGVLPPGELHVATPGDGFEIVPDATGLRSLSANGYVQVAVAVRSVDAAGSYSASWTSSEGAQLYLVAVR